MRQSDGGVRKEKRNAYQKVALVFPLGPQPNQRTKRPTENIPPCGGSGIGATPVSNQRIVRAKGSLLACAALLDPKGSDASWAIHFQHVSVPSARNKDFLQDRLLPTPSPHRAASVGNAELLPEGLSCCGRRGGALGCGGRLRRGWRRAFIPPSALIPPSSAETRARRIRSSRGERTPWRQQQRPRAETQVPLGCGRFGGASSRRRAFFRCCQAVIHTTRTNGEGGDSVGSSPRQRLAGAPLTAMRQDDYARPEVPKWAHKAVIIPG